MNSSILQRIHDTYEVLFVSHHAQLQALYRNYEKLVKENAPKAQLVPIFNQILSEAVVYFNSEEELLTLLMYDGLDVHTQEHKLLMATLRSFEKQFINGTLHLIEIADLIEIIKSRIESHRLEINMILNHCCVDNDNDFLGDFSVGEELNVHVSIFDVQHRNIDSLLITIHESFNSNIELSDILALLDELIDKLKVHFQHEESLMTRFSYPKLDLHKTDHCYFYAKMIEYKALVKRGALNEKLVEQIRLEINKHILTHDKQYANFFNNIGLY